MCSWLIINLLQKNLTDPQTFKLYLFIHTKIIGHVHASL